MSEEPTVAKVIWSDGTESEYPWLTKSLFASMIRHRPMAGSTFRDGHGIKCGTRKPSAADVEKFKLDLLVE